MGKNQRLLKLFVVLFFSSAFMFGTSHFGAKAFEKFNSDGSYSEGTTVGSVDISGKTETEVISLLEEKYVDWVNNTKIDLQFSEKTVPFDVNLFHFNAKQTVNNIIDGQKNTATITIEMLQVEEQIQILFPEIDHTKFELAKLTKDLTEKASLFETGTYSFNLTSDYIIPDATKAEVTISENVIELDEIPFDLESVIEANPEITIAEEATFSLLKFAEGQKIENSESLSVIATAMYQAILSTNFEIVERNISSVLPSYATLGFEAKVNFDKNADLVIVNPNKTKYNFELKLENNKLIVTLKGAELVYNYEILKKDEQQLKPKTIVQYSPLLLPGKTKVQNAGADGQIVKVYRDTFQGDKLIKSELLSEDYYAPAYRIEIHGLAETTNDNQPITGNEPTDVDDVQNGGQTPSPSNTPQQDSEEDELWGKPNEQAK
jgi:hypothetical protein